ncbi:MAG: hypothetical protein WC856_14410 [Methylococcaceae bacterium]|jgi:hypothetical protein
MNSYPSPSDTNIASKEVCELLHKLAALHLGVPITLFIDNARYQKCQLVLMKAASLFAYRTMLPTNLLPQPLPN